MSANVGGKKYSLSLPNPFEGVGNGQTGAMFQGLGQNASGFPGAFTSNFGPGMGRLGRDRRFTGTVTGIGTGVAAGAPLGAPGMLAGGVAGGVAGYNQGNAEWTEEQEARKRANERARINARLQRQQMMAGGLGGGGAAAGAEINAYNQVLADFNGQQQGLQAQRAQQNQMALWQIMQAMAYARNSQGAGASGGGYQYGPGNTPGY